MTDDSFLTHFKAGYLLLKLYPTSGVLMFSASRSCIPDRPSMKATWDAGITMVEWPGPVSPKVPTEL